MKSKIKNSLKAHLIFWPVTVVGLGLDLWSKKAVFNWLKTQPGHSVSVIDGLFRLVTAENPGAAFGIAGGQRWLLIVVSVIALIIIFAVLFFGRAERKLVYFALGLSAAAVLGNLYDRLFNNGRVRDFIDLYRHDWHWPAFNVADTMLCVAVGLFAIPVCLALLGNLLKNLLGHENRS